MWVAWFSPSVNLSRITAQLASLLTVDLIPYFLNSPSSCAITIDEQSVSAMIPNFIVLTSGPSSAHAPPIQPLGRPGNSGSASAADAASPEAAAFMNPRRLRLVFTGLSQLTCCAGLRVV